MRTRFRSLIAALAVTAAAATGGVVAAAPATAAPPRELPVFALLGTSFGTFGNHDFCRGSLGIRISSPRRGVAKVTLTSSGFIGNGPGWQKNPRCRVLIGMNFTNPLVTQKEVFFPATFGSKRGEQVSKEVVIGSGLKQVGIVSFAADTPVRVNQSYGSSAYFIVP